MKAHLTVARAWVEAHFAHYRVPSIPELFRVYRLYGMGKRAYHTIDHVAACLEFADKTFKTRLCGPEGRHNKSAWANLQLALIYHDAIYDVHSKTNEADSVAEFLIYADGKEVFAPSDTVEIGKLILLTKSHKLPDLCCGEHDTLPQMMIDTDMHVLALPWAASSSGALPIGHRRPTPWNCYSAYARSVWVEYSEFGRAAYTAGRVHFLKSLDPETVFNTPEMRTPENIERLRENIAIEVEHLTNGTSTFLDSAGRFR